MVKRRNSRIDWAAVGLRVRELRGFQVKQGDFALAIGVSQAQLSRYEKGISEMSAEALLGLAELSGKSIEWILTGREQISRRRRG
jgi:transcriptional regulator with XRE-family HTH domain